MDTNKGYVILCSRAKHLSGYFENYQEIELSKKTFSGKEILIFSENHFFVDSWIDKEDESKSFLVVQNFIFANDDLMELLLTIDLLKRMNVKDINVLIPYFAYSRQDKIYSSISSVGFDMVYNLISSCGAKNIYSIDIHSNVLEQNIINIETTKIFGNHILSKLLNEANIDIEDVSIISPDSGSKKRAAALASFINSGNVHNAYFFEKSRISENSVKVSDNLSKIGLSTQNDIQYSDQKEILKRGISCVSKTCIIIDDIISSGGTINECAKKLRNLGAKKVFCYCSHFLDFVVIPNNLDNIDKVFVSNTCCSVLKKEKEQKFTNIEIISIKDIITNNYCEIN